MTSVSDLYRETILDHSRNPRCWGELPSPPALLQEAYNPHCGDHYTLFLEREGSTISKVRFIGNGCAISTAAGSIMGEVVEKRSVDEVRRVGELFLKMVRGETFLLKEEPLYDLLSLFSPLSNYPARIECGTLLWVALLKLLETSGS